MVSDIENRFTWFKLDGPRFIYTHRDDYPDADVLMATGVGSVDRVLRVPKSKGVKFWWIRAHETWITPSENLFSRYRNPRLKKMVNSEGLKGFVWKETGINCTMMRPGLDFDVFRSMKKRNWAKVTDIVIGSLYTERPSKRFKQIPYIVAGLQSRGIGCRLRLFGTWETPMGLDFDEYLEKPSPDELSRFYNGIDFWLAPTKTEGLHIPPQEAMLCGCVAIGTAGELNGMNDYIENKVTGFLVDHPDKTIDILTRFVKDKDGFREKIAEVSKAGTRKILSFGDRKTNMQAMVDYFRKVIDGF
jgi:glycosyltransferase involved in cell wall biosynthesis